MLLCGDSLDKEGTTKPGTVEQLKRYEFERNESVVLNQDANLERTKNSLLLLKLVKGYSLINLLGRFVTYPPLMWTTRVSFSE